MKNVLAFFSRWLQGLLGWGKLGLRGKLILIFLLVKIIPLILLTTMAWRQFVEEGAQLRNISVSDSSAALNERAVENIERMTTDAAQRLADFLYGRDGDILFLADLPPTEDNYRRFIENKLGRVVKRGRWKLDPIDGESWIPAEEPSPPAQAAVSTNQENNDLDGFRSRSPDGFEYEEIPLYDEITFIDLEGNELIKVPASNSTKARHPLSRERRNVSDRANTYVKAETYFQELKSLSHGEVYVSDVIGAYVGSNYIGMYTPGSVAAAAEARGYAIDYAPEEQGYSGLENPVGRRFEGIVRWASPVSAPGGAVIGYVTIALNHDHIMEYVEHFTPMDERYVKLPSAYEGNYAFLWDYKCRSIVHPRHHSIVGFDPETGDPQVPWLENSIYEGWQASGLEKWMDFAKDYPLFHDQSRAKRPAPILAKTGLVGLDGRYLNFAPQCTGWMDLTQDGGSGSFYILWSGLYKLTTAAAVPYYTGQYAPSKANGFSKRGFAIMTIGSGLEFFTSAARETEIKLVHAIEDNLRSSLINLTSTTVILIILVIFVALWMAQFLTRRITGLIEGISRFRAGERQFRFNAPRQDEFGALADSFDALADGLSASIKNPLVIIGLDLRIIYANGLALRLIGKSLDEIAGLPYRDFSIYEAGSPHCPLKALEEGREAEICHIEKNGKRSLKGIANYLYDQEGKLSGYIIETIDVTEMVARQQALEEAVNDAQRANQHKGEFLARMSHEIRTPMNAIIGLSNIVGKSLDEMADKSAGPAALEEIKDNMRQIETSSHHLLGLLNDILDLSKIEAGKIELDEEVVELGRLAEVIVSIINPRCKEKDIKFVVDIEDFALTAFRTDSLRLRQVLINLLGNSVKFTPKLGRVELHIQRKDRREGETLVEFIVRDTGIGISESALAAIFRPFEQASGRIATNYGGTGLGLTISRHIVQLLGGDIDVKSREGEGSEFSFSLWLKETKVQVKARKAADDPAGKFQGQRMLLVDDVDLNRKIVRAMLKTTGLTIDEADHGKAALQKFSEAPENTYQMILMDVLMPHMNGYEATEAIRALDRGDARTVPIIALTAHAFKDDLEKALASGMNAHLAKPVKREDLVAALLRFLSPV